MEERGVMAPQGIGIVRYLKSDMTILPTVARVSVKSNRNVNFFILKNFNSPLILTKFLTYNEQNAYYQ